MPRDPPHAHAQRDDAGRLPGAAPHRGARRSPRPSPTCAAASSPSTEGAARHATSTASSTAAWRWWTSWSAARGRLSARDGRHPAHEHRRRRALRRPDRRARQLPARRSSAASPRTADVRDRLRIVEESLQEAHRPPARGGRRRPARCGSTSTQRQRERLLRAQMQGDPPELGEEGDGERRGRGPARARAGRRACPKEADAGRRARARPAGGHVAPSRPSTTSRAPTWAGSSTCPGTLTSKPRRSTSRKARAVLDRDHYGLDDVKERILEFLAVRRLKKDPRGPILCLAGPPGRGQDEPRAQRRRGASAAPSCASRSAACATRPRSRATGAPTSGAHAGQDPPGARSAPATRDPVFMHRRDRQDGLATRRAATRVSACSRCSTRSRTRAFLDHYLDLPFDLSRVFFVATAQLPRRRSRARCATAWRSSRSRATRGRRSATSRAGTSCRKRARGHGLTRRPARRSPTRALRAVIEGYTREAGVRDLERLPGQHRPPGRAARGDATGGKAQARRDRWPGRPAGRTVEATSTAPP